MGYGVRGYIPVNLKNLPIYFSVGVNARRSFSKSKVLVFLQTGSLLFVY